MNFETLKAQIGIGNLLAVGARDFAIDGAHVTFRVGSKRTLHESLTVSLMPDDTYDVAYVAISNRRPFTRSRPKTSARAFTATRSGAWFGKWATAPNLVDTRGARGKVPSLPPLNRSHT